MILRRHFPAPELARFVEFFWFFQDWEGEHSRERVLPDACFELVINLRDGTRKLFDREQPARYTSFRSGWLSGTHSRYIVIDAVRGASMIGVHFKPGGIRPFLGPSAAEFQDEVVEVNAIWDGSFSDLRERLMAASSPNAKFRLLEEFLRARLARSRIDATRRGRIAWASQQLTRGMDIRSIRGVAGELGISHKQFIAQFREEVGLNPKTFCRIRRFQHALAALHSRKPVRWAEVAAACGYYDQSHLIREFQEFAGLNPSAYRSVDADHASFVPVDMAR